MTIACDEPVAVMRRSTSPSLGMRVIGTLRLEANGNHYPPSELVALTGKKWGRLPRWMRRIVREHYNGRLPHIDGLLDHVGSCGDVLISEPYHLDAEALVAFVKKHNLDYSVSATSQHYPTRTICIRLWPKESQ